MLTSILFTTLIFLDIYKILYSFIKCVYMIEFYNDVAQNSCILWVSLGIARKMLRSQHSKLVRQIPPKTTPLPSAPHPATTPCSTGATLGSLELLHSTTMCLKSCQRSGRVRRSRNRFGIAVSVMMFLFSFLLCSGSLKIGVQTPSCSITPKPLPQQHPTQATIPS